MKGLHMVTFILLIVGGLNWGLQSIGYNVVDTLLGAGSTGANIVYGLVGISAIVEILTHKKNCKNCDKGGAGAM